MRKRLKKGSKRIHFVVLALFFLSILSLPIKDTGSKEAQKKKIVPQVQSAYTSPSITPVPPKNDDYCLTVPILLYHHVEPMREAEKDGHAQLTVEHLVFEQQMKYLKDQGYTTISVDQLMIALSSHTYLPPKSIIITLDDGYDDAYTYAYPILKKFGFLGNYMIATGLVGGRGYLTWSKLKEMTESGVVHVYNHTSTHAALGSISEEQIRAELDASIRDFRKNLDMNTTIFAYPYGSFNDRAIEILREKGFTAGIATLPGSEQCKSSIMTLHRTHIGNLPLSSYGF